MPGLRSGLPPRLTCVIPFCRRSTGAFVCEPPDEVWICGPHWRAVPRLMKLVKTRARRALRRAHTDKNLSRYERVASRTTRAALERAAHLR